MNEAEALSGLGYVASFVLGACVGSFLNVCIYRIPREESLVRPRSHCPLCGRAIAWFDNIPLLSYAWLLGKCRRCGARISPRYPLVEFLTALSFVLLTWRHGLSLRTPIYWMTAAGLIVATFTDLEHYIIPDRISLGGIVAGLVLSSLWPPLQEAASLWEGARAAVGGAVLGAGLLGIIGALGKLAFRQDAMGLGDVKLLAAVGALMGWRAVVFTLVVSAFVGALVGSYLLLTHRKPRRSHIPFGPFLALGAILWMLAGPGIWRAYVAWVTGEAIWRGLTR